MSDSHSTNLTTSRPRRDTGLSAAAVHKRRADALLLTGHARQLGPEEYLVPASWPDDHPLYHPDAHGRIDPLLAVETIRQVGILIAHEHLGVPQDHAFVLASLAVEMEPAAVAGDDRLPVEVVARPRHDRQDPRRTRTVMMAMFQAAGRNIARARIAWQTLNPSEYRATRWAAHEPGTGSLDNAEGLRAADRLPAARTGRRSPRDVVLAGPVSGPWRLQPDLAHPVLFDHPCDHVPGMVLLEGIRQAFACSGTDPSRAATTVLARFRRFGEWDAPVVIRGGGRQFIAEQEGRKLVEATVDRPGRC